MDAAAGMDAVMRHAARQDADVITATAGTAPQG
jgi:hypothetical protein